MPDSRGRAYSWSVSDVGFQPPLIVGVPRDLDLFSSEDAVGECLTPEYLGLEHAAYDSTGRRLELFVAPGRRHRRLLPDRREDIVHIRPSADASDGRDELIVLLREFLDRIGDPPLTEATLEDLLARAVHSAGYTR
jgi:hypothetical protein